MSSPLVPPWVKIRPYVIAEIGSNHDGEKGRALQLIASAAAAGATAAKFQLFKAQTLVVRDHPAFAMLERVSTPLEWLPDLAAACREAGIDFAATPFDLEAVDALAACRPAFVKIASSDITFVRLLQRSTATGWPILLSTGMSTNEDIRQALLCLQGAVAIALLHCVSIYPPSPAEMNLRAIPGMAQRFGLPVGLSDHTPGSVMAVAATALGGSIIEKHVTDDRGRAGPDHPFALEFAELAQLVRDVRHAAAALGDGGKRPSPAETAVRADARRGLYAVGPIAAGAVLDESQIIALRPAAAINAEQIDQVVGRRVPCPIGPGQPLPVGLLAKN